MTKRLVGLIVITVILGMASLVLFIANNVNKPVRNQRTSLEELVPVRKPVTKNQTTNSGPVKITLDLSHLQVDMGENTPRP